MIELLAMFAGGLLGSAHCVGMCGGFAAIVGVSQRSLPGAIMRQLNYGLGRVFTYTFLGSAGGYVGLQLGRFESTLIVVQRAFSVGAGLLMVIIGIMAFGAMRFRWRWLTSASQSAAPVFRHFLHGQGRGGVFLAGVVNGFLPCGLVLAFVAMAVASGSPVRGMLIMLFFGLGTIPAMTVVGCGSTLLSHGARLRVHRLAACFVIVAGVMSIVRGWPGRTGNSCCGENVGSVAAGEASAITAAAGP